MKKISQEQYEEYKMRNREIDEELNAFKKQLDLKRPENVFQCRACKDHYTGEYNHGICDDCRSKEIARVKLICPTDAELKEYEQWVESERPSSSWMNFKFAIENVDNTESLYSYDILDFRLKDGKGSVIKVDYINGAFRIWSCFSIRAIDGESGRFEINLNKEIFE